MSVPPVPSGSGGGVGSSPTVGHPHPVKVNLDDIWPGLETGMTTFLTELAAGFPKDKWMSMYT